ncbi:MAG: purine-nucleoside/S-methyl-5-thioadenosine phosphorylase / adenosine deaminase [Candidatus Sumerlaeota bacterium]|nr:purine-nucleoside/S-methyl-5-thioadenosine phosphorylase / adenosine deaminase [Candidatus Sumerlaeota bacterium]
MPLESPMNGITFREDAPGALLAAEGRCVALASTPELHWQREGACLAAAIREALDAAPDTPVLTGEQVHGSVVAEVTGAAPHEDFTEVPGVDGLWTRQRGVVLVARSADCVPVVLAAPEAGWLAVVHAGWRGTKGRIVEKSIDAAFEAGIVPESMHVWIGPCIGGDVYEVSPELAEEFAAEFASVGYRRNGRLLDLRRVNVLQASSRGVPERNIAVSAHCTLRSSGRLPSYRRDGECRGQIYTAAILAKQTRERT